MTTHSDNPAASNAPEKSKTEQAFLLALARLQCGNPEHPRLRESLTNGKLRITIATIAEEAGHSRTLIGHENCPYLETRLTILDAIKNSPGRQTLRNEELRLTSEKADLANKLGKRRTTYAELAARVNAYERGLLSEPKKGLTARLYRPEAGFQGETLTEPPTLVSAATISAAAPRPVPDNEKSETLKQRIKRLRSECRDLENRLDEHDTAYCELVLRARADERGHLADGKRKVKATPAQQLASLVVVGKSNRHLKE
ncbi:hypothetical protein [Burkholderia pseudomallei]|uniref:hypothetical protein n=1 Tax=Burkholderia pseudomallei TaxID=28450 RepID=UPI001AD6C5AC|nr:hypothetical protein [Burkholderia pseudomallei]MBO7825954.1 hypothetical protein [Burkholderia pseudomallei]